MKIIKVVYNNDTKFILDIINTCINNSKNKVYKEEFNIDHYKDKKRAIPILTRFGTKNVPLIVFENEALEEYKAIWSENSPNWEIDINKILNN